MGRSLRSKRESKISAEMLEGRGPRIPIVFGSLGLWRPSLSHFADIPCRISRRKISGVVLDVGLEGFYTRFFFFAFCLD